MSIHTPVVPTQGIYRALLHAMSHPARLSPAPVDKSKSLLLAVSTTLLDHEVSFCVLPSNESKRSHTWDEEIFCLTKAKITAVKSADYIIIDGHHSRGIIDDAKSGTPDFPDQSATLIYVMDTPLDLAITNETAPILSGPGIASSMHPEVNPITTNEWKKIALKNAEFPLGVDVICLIGNNSVLSIPRSTKICME